MKENLMVANALLQVIQYKIMNTPLDEKIKKEGGVWVECFDNCREQGYVIIVWKKNPALRIAFSENRNSDDIVVYNYKKTSHNNLPAQDDWNSKFFGYGNYNEASNYIINLIEEEFAEVSSEEQK